MRLCAFSAFIYGVSCWCMQLVSRVYRSRRNKMILARFPTLEIIALALLVACVAAWLFSKKI